jgi:hypothetical protein
MKSVLVVAALVLILAGCSSSGTIGASGDNSGIDSSGAIGGAVGSNGSGGASGGSLAGGAGKVDGVDVSGLSQADIAGATDAATCQALTKAVSDGENAIENAFPDNTRFLAAYTSTADAISGAAGKAVGPVRTMALDVVVGLRAAAAQIQAHPSEPPLRTKNPLDALTIACQKNVSNGVKGSQLTICAYLENQFATADGKLAAEAADPAKFSGDAQAAAKAIRSVKDQADKADSTANLQAVVVDASEAYGKLDVGTPDTFLEFDIQHENLAEFCDGDVKLF